MPFLTCLLGVFFLLQYEHQMFSSGAPLEESFDLNLQSYDLFVLLKILRAHRSQKCAESAFTSSIIRLN